MFLKYLNQKHNSLSATLLSLSITLGYTVAITAPAEAQVNRDPVTTSNIDCGGNMGNPHFSKGTFDSSGLYQIHSQARNWCNNVPNQLTLATAMYRSSWRGWLMQNYIGKGSNPKIKENATKSSPNVLVAVAECSPGSRYRWRAEFENSAIIQGEPWASVHPVMYRETPDEIDCAR